MEDNTSSARSSPLVNLGDAWFQRPSSVDGSIIYDKSSVLDSGEGCSNQSVGTNSVGNGQSSLVDCRPEGRFNKAPLERNQNPNSGDGPQSKRKKAHVRRTSSQASSSSTRRGSWASASASHCSQQSSSNERKTAGRKRKTLTEDRRVERNVKEKERSSKISMQFLELQNLLSGAGVVVPKGTKGCVLHAAMSYIQMLQQQIAQKDQDNRLLAQQMQCIGQGMTGQKAATLAQQVASPHQNGAMLGTPMSSSSGSNMESPWTSVVDEDYHLVFEQTPVAMALVNLGGSFLDCNKFFCSLSKYSKEDLRSISIFNMVHPDHLQEAFNEVSQLLQQTNTATSAENEQQPFLVFQSALEGGGLNVHIRMIGNANKKNLLCVLLDADHQAGLDPTTNNLVIPASLEPRPLMTGAGGAVSSTRSSAGDDKAREYFELTEENLAMFAVG